MTDSLNPYRLLADVPNFAVTSTDIRNGVSLAAPHTSGIFGAGGNDTSPHLSWSGFPEETASFAITCLDPAAPTGSGFWHWAACDIPASVTELPTGAGDEGGERMPDGTVTLANDAGLHQYLGAAPPEGHGPHPYYFVVHAVDVTTLGLDSSTTPAMLGFNLAGHTLARGMIVPVWGR